MILPARPQSPDASRKYESSLPNTGGIDRKAIRRNFKPGERALIEGSHRDGAQKAA
jgi:hypothetical protein